MSDGPRFARVVFNDGSAYFGFFNQDGEAQTFGSRHFFLDREDWEEHAQEEIDTTVAFCDGDEREAMLKDEFELITHCRQQIPADWVWTGPKKEF